MSKNGSGSKVKGSPRKKPGPKPKGPETSDEGLDDAVEISELTDVFVTQSRRFGSFTFEEAGNIFGKIEDGMQEMTDHHLQDPPRCFCGATLRFGKEKGDLCETCSKDRRPWQICASMAEAEKSRRR